MSVIQVEAIGGPEFINIVPYNPLYSQCDIKVFYLGENRNKVYISKETAIKMAASLPGSPIVGQYMSTKQDFHDHGERIVISGNSISKECLTTPFGFVAPDAKVWFQKFKEKDEYGNEAVREYMMTTGYLWTGQFPECQCVIDEGRPQSMELDEETLDGSWTKNYNRNVEFFIINDAIFSKLCILGEDIEPCFEGANITSPEVTFSFNMDKKLTTTLFTMMQELKQTLQEGGQTMPEEKNFSESQDKIEKTDLDKNDIPMTKDTLEEPVFAKKEDEDKEKTTSEGDAKKEEPVKDEEKPEAKEDKPEEKKEEAPKAEDKDKAEDEEKKKKFALLSEEHDALKVQYEELQNKFSLMEAELNELKAFKLAAENEQKDKLIQSFYMLSDEDKKEVVENKAKYSLEDIESKLSVICVRKKVSFDNQEEEKNDVSVTFSLDDCGESSTPAWISAIKNTQKNKNNY